jgi:hypothetical protein
MSMGQQNGRLNWWASVVVDIARMASVAGKNLMSECQSALQRPVDGCSVCLAEHRHCSSPMLHHCTCCSANSKHSQRRDSHHRTDPGPDVWCSDRIVWLIEHEVDRDLRGQDQGQLEVDTELWRRDRTQTNSDSLCLRGSSQDTG